MYGRVSLEVYSEEGRLFSGCRLHSRCFNDVSLFGVTEILFHFMLLISVMLWLCHLVVVYEFFVPTRQ